MNADERGLKIEVLSAARWLAWAVLCPMAIAFGQDPFEIHVYEYETLRRGQYTFETHLNYRARDFHVTLEWTAGLTEWASIGVMQLNARRPGYGLEYAGVRVLPHFYVPRAWHWPVDVGLVAEFSFQNTRYEENARRLEVRPILEKSFGRLQIDFNPVFERALHGPGVADGWAFEPAGRVGYEAFERFTPSVEYYSSWGPLPTFLPRREQFHQILPGGDLKIGKNVVWSFGVGIAATPVGGRPVYKSRIEVSFGGKK